MFRLKTVAVVVLLTASSLLTLWLMGLSQWIQAILVIGVELSLGVVLHELIEGPGRRERRPRHGMGHRPPSPSHRRRASHAPPHRHPARPDDAAAYVAKCRLLLPVRDDRPELLDYALRECRSHRAELDLLYLRDAPEGATSGAAEEDDEARGVIERARRRAGRAGVPFRSLFAVTDDAPATILDRAASRGADLVVMAAPRCEPTEVASRLMARDDVRRVIDDLPDHIGLLVHS